ncbi:MAG: hypothetical protein EAX87_15030 [Candidatus Thorarchaeota archaeon]|nr:hypothetical protein [Candidatus Thorarchaeota archaeon]
MHVSRNRQSNHDRHRRTRSGLNQPLWFKDLPDGIQNMKPTPGLPKTRIAENRYRFQSQSEKSLSLTIPWSYVFRSKLMQLLRNDRIT